MKLRKGDKVIVRSGKDAGKSGTILEVLPALNKVVVDGINMAKRATKPSTKHPRGGIIEGPLPLWASKVGLVHPTKENQSSRVGYVTDKAGNKQRVYRQADDKEVK